MRNDFLCSSAPDDYWTSANIDAFVYIINEFGKELQPCWALRLIMPKNGIGAIYLALIDNHGKMVKSQMVRMD